MFDQLPTHHQTALTQLLTPTELRALTLSMSGLGTRRISTLMRVSHTTTRDTLRRAQLKAATILEPGRSTTP